MNTRFVLVRHAACAQTDSVLLGRSVDAPLGARGRAQASALAWQLARERPVVVATSPRLRARQTAIAIAAHADCAMFAFDALDEVDFGSWCGQSFATLARDPHWQRWNTQRGLAATPAGETIVRVRARATTCLRALADRFGAHTIVVVTHAEVIRTLLLRACRKPANSYWQIDVPPASTTTLSLRGDEFRTADAESLAA